MSSEVGILETPDPELEKWRAEWLHCAASIAEGICPAHRTPLAPVNCRYEGDIGGHCAACRVYWRYQRSAEEVGWTVDHNSLTFKYVIPEWVA